MDGVKNKPVTSRPQCQDALAQNSSGLPFYCVYAVGSYSPAGPQSFIKRLGAFGVNVDKFPSSRLLVNFEFS